MKIKIARKYLILISLVLLLGPGAFFWQVSIANKSKISSAEKDKKLQEMLGRELRKENEVRSPKTYSGKSFNLTYPGTMELNTKVNSQATQSAQQSEVLKLSQHQPSRVNFVAMVIKTGTELDDYSGVSFRRNSINTYQQAVTSGYQQSVSGAEKLAYKEEKVEVDSRQALVFSKRVEGAEKTAFLSQKGGILSFSATGNNFEEVEKVFDEIIKTVKLLN
jgi:hypothetical protein